MDQLVKTITFEKAHAEVSKFDNGTEVREYHVMLHVDSRKVKTAIGIVPQ